MTMLSDSVDLRIGSILFTDLVGFTDYTDAVGDVEALKVLEHQTRMVDTVLSDHGAGRVVKELGDGLMIWFGSAVDGLSSSVALMEVIESARSGRDFPLAVRMGLHFGEALARGDDLVGRTINIAARVSDLAGPGELLVTEDVVAALAGQNQDVDLQPIGPVVVKGVQEPVWLRRLTL